MYIKESLLTSKSRPKQGLTPVGLVVHDTDDPGATAQNEHDYFQNQGPQASAHAFVDWNGIIQLIPWNEVAWHAGHTANHTRIGIELCVPKPKDEDKFDKVWNNAVELFAFLVINVLKQSTVTKENLMSHAEVSNRWKETDHQDPIDYFRQYGKTVDDFRDAVQAKISGVKTVTSAAKNYSVITTKDVQIALNLLKYNCGAPDGIIGPKTIAAIKKFQRNNNLKDDGIIGPITKAKLKELINK